MVGVLKRSDYYYEVVGFYIPGVPATRIMTPAIQISVQNMVSLLN